MLTGYKRLFSKKVLWIRRICLTAAVCLLCTACRVVQPDLLVLYSFRSGGVTVEFSTFADQRWLTVTPNQILEAGEDGEPVSLDPTGPALSSLRQLRFLDENPVNSPKKGWIKKTTLVYDDVSFQYYWYPDRVILQFGEDTRSLRLFSGPDGTGASAA